VIARSQRSLGHEVFYLTGTDEHGQKVQAAAQGGKQEPAGLLRWNCRQLEGLNAAKLDLS